MDEKLAFKILNQVRDFYNQAAESFSLTRQKRWFEFEALLKNLSQGKEKILDFGCGNGRFSEIFEKERYFGVDFSSSLIHLAKKRYPQKKFFLIDGLHLPFKDEFFDFVFSIAVFHHIPSQKLRIKVLKEIKRVLKKDGIFLLSVWYLWSKISIWKLILKFTLKKLIGKNKMDFFDLYLPWQGKYLRYFHLFSKNSLKKEVKKAGFSVEKVFVLKRGKEKNLILIAKK